jgi:hypothetical protein
LIALRASIELAGETRERDLNSKKAHNRIWLWALMLIKERDLLVVFNQFDFTSVSGTVSLTDSVNT